MKKYVVIKEKYLQQTYGVIRNDELEELVSWENSPSIAVDEPTKNKLETLRKALAKRYGSWNEQEITIKFIAPMVEMLPLPEGYYIFYERPLTATFPHGDVTVVTDMLIARDDDDPELPIFGIQEYKKQIPYSKQHPMPQLLLSLIIARTLNHDVGYDKPLYGAFNMGINWGFVVLQGEEYAVSKLYSAMSLETSEGLSAIWRILGNMLNKLPVVPKAK